MTGNLHVVNGAGKTNGTPNGLGNLIIGYNEQRTGSRAVNTRTGSHNLILGALNNFSSYGGIVGGYSNTISGGYATVTGGSGNTASGSYASVTGGHENTASGPMASVTGGYDNTASGGYAAVGGGDGFSASTQFAFLPTSPSQASLQSFQNQITSLQTTTSSLKTSVAGATAITNLFSLANGVGTKTELTLTGVNLHIVNGLGATNGEPSNPTDTASPVINGLGNLIIGYNATGNPNSADTRTGSHNLIVGDENNYSSYGGIVAGLGSAISAAYAGVTGGNGNTASGIESSVSGGDYGTASGQWSAVSGGNNNHADGDSSAVSGGEYNYAESSWSSASGGGGNTADGADSWAAGGYGNYSSGLYTAVTGGYEMSDASDYSWAAGSLHSP